jgi:signal transduction histidine kinase
MKGAIYLQYGSKLVILLLLYLLTSCGEIAPTQQIDKVDALNKMADEYRYSCADSTYKYSKEAYSLSENYQKGRAEACNHLAFCALIHMDYATAERYYYEAMRATTNELEQLFANIGLMHLCQITADNTRFYDYKYKAEGHIQRINDDRSVFFDAHSRYRLQRAFNEFALVCAAYHRYLQQEEEVRTDLNRILPQQDFMLDAPGYLYYRWLRTNNNRFEMLYNMWHESVEKGYHYWAGQSLLSLVDLLSDTHQSQRLLAIQKEKIRRDLGVVATENSLLSAMLKEAEDHLILFCKNYPKVTLHRHRGTVLNAMGLYGAAVHELSEALNGFNTHYLLYYASEDKKERELLQADKPSSATYTELKWITNPRIMTYPACLANVREELSVAYAGLHRKPESDYNRNVYLDILDYTRQDRKLEHRYDNLQRESQQLNFLLVLIVVVITALTLFVLWINKRWRKRNENHVNQLERTLLLSEQLFSSLPVSATSLTEIFEKVMHKTYPIFTDLFGQCCVILKEEKVDSTIDTLNYPSIQNNLFYLSQEIDFFSSYEKKKLGALQLRTKQRLTQEQQTLLKVIAPYWAWIIENGRSFIAMGDEQVRIEKEHYLHELRIKKGREENLNKQACLGLLNNMRPFIDRLLHETRRLNTSLIKTEKSKEERLSYIKELVLKINEYNEILALWIKLKQGEVGFHIESFELKELFEMTQKRQRSFEMKSLHFEVKKTETIVKADKVLTLFMVNTLLENARKYTLKGGQISLEAIETDNYVEVSIQDTGIGLSEEDQHLLMHAKVYDASQIGRHNENKDYLSLKGAGFGLMNCRGIIEGYKKMNPLFEVCRFGVESKLNKGSRFYFRLPKGLKRTMMYIVFLVSFVSCQTTTLSEWQAKNRGIQEEKESKEILSDTLLQKAMIYADSAYYANVEGHYKQTLRVVEQAMNDLNLHFSRYYKATEFAPQVWMSLTNSKAEVIWYKMGFHTDYRTILDLRNETAVAALALHEWKLYHCNNQAYTQMYKLLSKDTTLEQYCMKMQRNTGNKRVAIVLSIAIFLLLLFAYLMLYYRRRVIVKMNLEQVLAINEKAFQSSLLTVEADRLMQIPELLLRNIFDYVNELLYVDSILLALKIDENPLLQYVAYPKDKISDEEKENINYCFENEQIEIKKSGKEIYVPLSFSKGEAQRRIGVLVLHRTIMQERRNDRVLIQLIARFITILLSNTVMQKQEKWDDIELARDEQRRAEWEENLIHVQNRLLDNSLSTLKHETIYYPHRILQIVEQMGKSIETYDACQLADLIELTSYYKEMYTLLYHRTVEQFKTVFFKRQKLATNDLFAYAQQEIARMQQRCHKKIELEISTSPLFFWGDEFSMHYLIRLWLNTCCDQQKKEETCNMFPIQLSATEEKDWIRIDAYQPNKKYAIEELELLFSPSLTTIKTNTGETLKYENYWIIKQIIREHDEYAGRRGCRIYAHQHEQQGGTIITFTLPKVKY